MDELRQFLNCEEDESYAAFKVFNDRILKRSQKELHEKTECRFAYEPVKTGRRVTGVRFTLETLADTIEPVIPGQMSIKDYEDEDPNAVIAEALPDSFTPEQVETLRVLASPKVPWIPGGALPRECAIADYLRRKVLMMNATKTDKPYPYNYLKAMIEQDDDAFYS